MSEFVSIAPDVRLGKNVKLSKFINLYGCTVGDETKIGAFVEIQKNATVGNNCKVSSHTFICEGVDIEDDVFIGHSVTFVNDTYPRATAAGGGLQTEADWKVEKTKVCKGASIGSGSTILANLTIGSHFGWRQMFLFGGLPALLLAWIRYGVAEPVRWQQKEKVIQSLSWWRPLATLFNSTWRRRTILNSLFMLASICGLWAGTVYVPTAVTTLAEASGRVGPQAAHLASYATILVAFATILGCLAMPTLAERFGRRATLAMFFALMFVFIVLTFGKVFYLGSNALPWFFLCLFFLGLGGANFSVYTLWLPEQYPTECRASAFAFSTSFARFIGAGITFLVGAGVRHFGSLGTPVALTGIAFAIGLLLTPLGEETRGRVLPP